MTLTQARSEMQAPPQTQSIAEARDLVSFATRCVEALAAAAQRLPPQPELEEEHTWLRAAARRVEQHVAGVARAITAAVALPEFEAERQAQRQALFDAWVDSVEGLLVGISSQLSANSPLIEVLFPHQRFDKLRRGGTAARTYLSELERRRRTAYIVRLAGEPEYEFLRALLGRFDDAKAALEAHEQPITLSADELATLRNSVFVAADALRAVLHQARLLAEAALSAYPGWFVELGLDAKPKKRSVRSSAPEAESA